MTPGRKTRYQRECLESHKTPGFTGFEEDKGLGMTMKKLQILEGEIEKLKVEMMEELASNITKLQLEVREVKEEIAESNINKLIGEVTDVKAEGTYIKERAGEEGLDSHERENEWNNIRTDLKTVMDNLNKVGEHITKVNIELINSAVDLLEGNA